MYSAAAGETSAHPHRLFSLAEIQSATKDFADELVIGKGGFGKVYKGNITSDHFVAIKRLDSMSNQGEIEFRTEIQMLSELRHQHLVSLIGYCDDNKEMILVYEYMPHGTLYHHLHKDKTPFSWIHRIKIAIGAARGLEYLHTGDGTKQEIIHRDVKSLNILLDEKWEAMISDFGLSKLFPTDHALSYVFSSVKGTFGYLDPEFFYTRKLSSKTDVYAFGVVLFELLSGRLAVDERYGEEQCSLVRWAQKCVKDRKLDQMVDSNIRGTMFPKCLRMFAKIADRCLLSVPKERPTMTEVVASLQALLSFQDKYESSVASSSTTWFTSKITNYFRFSTKVKSDTKKDSDWIGSVHLTMSQVARATNNFSRSLLLGEGGFGSVYKAQLPNGQVFAIKRAREGNFNFRPSEVELLGKTDHWNLVKLLGYVNKGNERIIITEYVCNGTLREHLDGHHGSFLDFNKRLEIGIGIADGLTYLHLYAGQQIIHRDVKSSNILLTERLRAKVADFGFARLGDAKTDNTPIVTQVKGTVGYLDPEYLRTYQLTPKSDVYSFGVLLIEILTGRRPIESRRSVEEKVTVRWAFGKYNEGNIMDLVDPHMKDAVDGEIFAKMLGLAFQCVASTRENRPEMKVVGEQLWVIRMNYLRHGRRG